jgi:hypothetical protein
MRLENKNAHSSRNDLNERLGREALFTRIGADKNPLVYD